jgi:acetylornithine deacetylase/succinyl-diaminopimelate desuccinylase-like protein
MKGSLRRASPEFLAVTLVVVAAFLALWFDAWRISRPTTDSAYVPGDTEITREIELLQEYIRLDTSNPPGREREAAEWLARQLRDVGVEPEIIETAPGRANVLARLRGRTQGEGLLLTHHIDVVPADAEHWTEPPFAANIRMNQLYGRGALDMKSIGICHLAAFIDLARSGEPLERDLVFLAVADEEEGGALGMGWLVRHRPDIFDGIRYALNEGGVAESLRDTITYFGIEVGTKQLVTINLSSNDRRTLEKTRNALLPLQSPEDPTRVLPEVPPILAGMAAHRVSGRVLLQDVDRVIAEGDFWKLHPTYRYLMQNLVRLDGIRERDGGFVLRLVLENLPDQVPESEIERVRAIVAPFGVDVDVVLVQGPSPISSWATPFYEDIEHSVRQTYGDVGVGPQIQPLVSNDSRYLRAIGIQAYGMWPFPVSLYQTLGIHQVDERVRLDWFMEGVEMSRYLVRRYATGRHGVSQESDK